VAAYIARRAALGLLTLWLVSIAIFGLIRVAPGDAVTAALALAPGEGGLTAEQIEQRRNELGLNRSWAVQHMDWLGDVTRGDFGRSLATGAPVIEDLRPRVAVTLELAALSLALAVIAGIGGGLLAATRKGGTLDFALRGLAFAGLSIPAFWTGLLSIVAVSAWTGVFLAGRFEPFTTDPLRNLAALMPAAAVLAVRPSALMLRVARNSTLEASLSQFFLLARLKGASAGSATARHAFRASALPSATVLGAQAVFMLGGAVVVEQVFGLPGLGRGLVNATLARDYPMVQATVMLFAIFAVCVNLGVDLLYVRLDPRVRQGA
jgi:peptide/nickel transport system permease protein